MCTSHGICISAFPVSKRIFFLVALTRMVLRKKSKGVGKFTPIETSTLERIACQAFFFFRETFRSGIFLINPLLFSTPGMSDESNALVCVKVDSIQNLNADGCEGSELFDGYSLLTIEDALRILKNGKDDNHIFYSVYTWAALMVFVSKMWL